MSETLPLLPETAPFSADHIAALNRVIAKTTAGQRAWLTGFLAGYQVAQPQAAPAAAPTRKAPLTILYATESGNAETLAAAARKVAGKLGFNARVLDMANTTPADVAKANSLLLIASTWGEGDPPQRAVDFHAALMADSAPRFDGVPFAVLALGDRAYAQFCETGRHFDERLEALGGVRVTPRIDCDVDYEDAAKAWIDGTLAELGKSTGTEDDGSAVIHVDFAGTATEQAWTRSRPFTAEITEKVNLNSSRSSSETWHVELSLAGSGITYEPGDSLGFVPTNDPELVEAVLNATGLGGDAELHATLAEGYDITTLTRQQIEAYAALTGDAALKQLAGDRARTLSFLPGRQVIDLLEAAPHKLQPEQLLDLLRKLPPRLYSIASSRKAVADGAHLLISTVRYETHGRARLGVASDDVARRRKAGDTMPVYLKPNPHFRLPIDPARNIVMIGPGTGIAPFRAFMQEREAIGAAGKSWLFFGARNFTHDFLYQLEWQDLLKRSVLSRLDVAFSRDQPKKVYVQDRMWQARRELFAWLEDGATLYVCGDAKAMAKDVHAMLARIVADQGARDREAAEAFLDDLRRAGRYLRDVY